MHCLQLLHPELHRIGQSLHHEVSLVATRTARVDSLNRINHGKRATGLANTRLERVGYIHQTLLGKHRDAV